MKWLVYYLIIAVGIALLLIAVAGMVFPPADHLRPPDGIWRIA